MTPELGQFPDFSAALREIEKEIYKYEDVGKVASYIPELARINPNKFGLYLISMDGRHYCTGAYEERFSIQSIVKVFKVAMAMTFMRGRLWKRVGVEPSGNAFNSLVQLEYENGIPRNPFINAGALVVSDVLTSYLTNPKEEFLQYVRQITNDPTLAYNERVARSEAETGFTNKALMNFMKSYGNIHGNVDEVLDFYFHTCSLEMSCYQLAKAFTIFANKGRQVETGSQILNADQAKRVNALMQTCGFYDESGEFTFRVGIPGKSGVGGGIAAVYPGMYSVAVWSPRLNSKGNSVMGMRSLEMLTTITGASIF